MLDHIDLLSIFSIVSNYAIFAKLTFIDLLKALGIDQDYYKLFRNTTWKYVFFFWKTWKNVLYRNGNMWMPNIVSKKNKSSFFK